MQHLELKSFILGKFSGKIEILITIISPVENLQMSVGILLEIRSVCLKIITSCPCSLYLTHYAAN